MANKTYDGGPAFPKSGFRIQKDGKLYRETIEAQEGMSLLDWFAGMALQGIAANPEFANIPTTQAARWSWQYANAMLKAKKETVE